MPHLFVYGSLLFPDLVTELTGKSFRSSPATLDGFKRYRVKGCDYPAIIKAPGANVEGLLIENVDESSLEILVFFEGNEYRKQQVTVISSAKQIAATAFIWTNDVALLENSDWDEAEFRKQSLTSYLKEVAPETRAAFQSLKNT